MCENVCVVIFCQSIEALNALVEKDGTQLLDRFLRGLGNAYAGSRLVFSYTLTHMSGTEATSVKVQSPSFLGREGGYATATNLSTFVPPEPSSPSTKELCRRSEKAPR